MIEERDWELFQSFPDQVAASAVCQFLAQSGVPARVEGASPGVALDTSCRVMVPGAMLRRAQWLWAQSDLTPAELHYLATGELGDDDEVDRGGGKR